MPGEDFRKRDRSPNFPYLTLTQALEKVEVLYRSAKGSFVRLSDAAGDWGLSPTSSSTLRYASALIAYGLIVDEGSGESRRLKLTDAALRILGDTRPGVREELLEKAALNPDIVREYYTKWCKGRPNDTHAVSTLIFDSSFTEKAARTFLQVFDDAVTYVSDEAESSKSANRVEEGGYAKRHPSSSSALDIPGETASPDSSERRTDTILLAQGESEWLKARVSKNVSVRIITDGDLDPILLRRLIRMIETQCEMMEEDL